ncbi:MAG: amino acid permease [Bacteroidales bacterium]|nr:amino acid permease [Bacteroidales bacterium]MCF8402356.1 amino acid permease [Bacteroidales bacterium]
MENSKKFGTFLGVYTPSVLTILGLIMYLRFGWVVGNLGLLLTIFVVILASSITFITGLSASAIATNMNVGVGGEYYIISRSLGLELGGSIGIPLYFCRTLSITFYSYGLAEALLLFWPDSWGIMPTHTLQFITIAIILLITTLSGKSASLVLKVQIPIMILVGLSLLALFFGSLSGGPIKAPELIPSYRTAPEGFWYVFAVFFPAVTGFTAGIGMSGDLKNPRKSIPRGTIWAVLTGVLIYIAVPVLLSVTSKISPEELAGSGVDSWIKVAIFGSILVYPAIWGAILSSAFGSVLGGPRVLQALAQDGLAPKFFARLSKSGQPTTATWMSGAIAMIAVFIGGLNTIAQFVSILFLTLYVMVNMSAVIERLVKDPSFRPTIKVPWYISLAGAIGAISVMFLISPTACVLAVILEIGLYVYLARRTLEMNWGDARAGFWRNLIRYALIQIRIYGSKPRNWRPRILLFIKDAEAQMELIKLASWFSQIFGISTVVKLIIGHLTESKIDIENHRLLIKDKIMRAKLTAFSEVIVVPEFEVGAITVAQSNGLIGIKANTIMFGWSESHETKLSQQRIIRAVSQANKSTILARIKWPRTLEKNKSIDLWWGGQQRNGDLMLLLAHLLVMNKEWERASITIRSIVDSKEVQGKMMDSIQPLIPKARINANLEVLVKKPGETVTKVIQQYSKNSTIVLLGLKITQSGGEEEYVDFLEELISPLNTVVLVNNPGLDESTPILLEV